MKLFLYAAAVVALSTLAACQSSSVGPGAASTRQIEVTGAQARYTVEVPQSAGATSTAAPFALQGSSSGAPAVAPGNGYQSR